MERIRDLPGDVQHMIWTLFITGVRRRLRPVLATYHELFVAFTAWAEPGARVGSLRLAHELHRMGVQKKIVRRKGKVESVWSLGGDPLRGGGNLYGRFLRAYAAARR